MRERDREKREAERGRQREEERASVRRVGIGSKRCERQVSNEIREKNVAYFGALEFWNSRFRIVLCERCDSCCNSKRSAHSQWPSALG